MHPTVNSDESITAGGSADFVRYTDYSSRHPKEQISGTKNAQTEYEAHLLQNAAHSSTYKPSTSDGRNAIYRERHGNDIVENQRDVSNDLEQPKQKHKNVDTQDIDRPHKHRSKSCTTLRLWCARLCRRKKEYSERVLGESTRYFLERMKERKRECLRRDDVAVTDVSAPLHREPLISRPSAPRKSKRGRKQDEAVEVADKDVFEESREERKKRERKEKENREKERRERRERRKRGRRMPHFIVDTHLVHDEDLQVPVDRVDEDRRIPGMKAPLPLTDIAKSCCYLCTRNTLAIATASTKPEQSDKSVQVSAHKFHAETSPMLDKSCSPILLLRTVQSSIKVRTRETSTLCPGPNVARRRETESRPKKRKKFNVFLGLTRTKCPAGRHAACGTDKPATARRDDNEEKREPRNEKCCREKND